MLQVYHKYFGRPGEKQGWADRAYVNYFAGPPDGKHAKMTEDGQARMNKRLHGRLGQQELHAST